MHCSKLCSKFFCDILSICYCLLQLIWRRRQTKYKHPESICMQSWIKLFRYGGSSGEDGGGDGGGDGETGKSNVLILLLFLVHGRPELMFETNDGFANEANVRWFIEHLSVHERTYAAMRCANERTRTLKWIVNVPRWIFYFVHQHVADEFCRIAPGLPCARCTNNKSLNANEINNKLTARYWRLEEMKNIYYYESRA